MRLEFLRGHSLFENQREHHIPKNFHIMKLWEKHELRLGHLLLNRKTSPFEEVLEKALDLMEEDNPLSSHEAAELILNRPVVDEERIDLLLSSTSKTMNEKVYDLVDIRRVELWESDLVHFDSTF